MGFVIEHDGQFWMDFEDFASNYNILVTVHLNLYGFSDDSSVQSQKKYKWNCKEISGSWIPGKNAGGGYGEDFWKNPQYVITFSGNSSKQNISSLTSHYSNDNNQDYSSAGDNYSGDNYYSTDYYSSDDYRDNTDTGSNKSLSTIIVSLFSKDNNRESNRGEIVNFPKQFFIYKLINDDENTVQEHIHNNKKFESSEVEKVGQSDMVGILREISKRFELSSGTYIIIPCTNEVNVAGNFLLRYFTESNFQITDSMQLDEQTDIQTTDSY